MTRRCHQVDAHEEGAWVDVDEHRACTDELDGVCGRRERVGRDDHLVARADPEREHPEMERRGAGRHGHRVRRPDGAGEQALELPDLRPHRQLAGGEHLRDRGELGLADVGTGEPDRVGHAAPSFSRYQSIVRARPSSSSTFASKPSTSRAFLTSGIRSSTSV